MTETGKALSLILDHCQLLASRSLSIMDASGLMLSEDVIAPYDIPAYRQTSMDGYAFAFDSIGVPLKVIGEQAAGDGRKFELKPGEAVRIFTGGAVPEGADTVVMQEKATLVDGSLILDPGMVQKGDHVRLVGSEVHKGAVALQRSTLLTPPVIGFLAAIGVSEVPAIPSPRISIIVTGNELLKPGDVLEYGKVFEASSFALRAVLEGMNMMDVKLVFVKDDADAMTSVLAEALGKSDMVLMTGGVSVGDHDHTAEAAARAGIEKVFHKVKQRPGKPLFFGVRNRRLFFGLPGNPSSVLTCFYEYVLPALQALTGRPVALQGIRARLAADHRKTAGLTHFLKGIHHNGLVEITGGQESYKLHSFALANCLVVLPEEATDFAAGEEVDIHLLP
jgi:molybdopterin molybdotransferase